MTKAEKTESDLLPHHHAVTTNRRRLASGTRLHNAGPDVHRMLALHANDMPEIHDLVSDVYFVHNIPAHIRHRVLTEFGVEFGGNEAFAVELSADGATVYGSSPRGLLYGATALVRASLGGVLADGLMYDTPACPVRAVRLYLPSAAQREFFTSLIDILAYYRYNQVIIEVGGAFEYRRHPEINAAWRKYCREVTNREGGTDGVIHGFPWYKNSIHPEVGDGDTVDQNTVSEIVRYCRSWHMDVIPEVPSLSHCDYLMVAHPELAERTGDPYPDTYCPRHPHTYRLLFDVLDEVCDVFQPAQVHIGHDEWYSIAKCPQCQGADSAALFIADIERIQEYAASRNVQTIMYADKLLDARNSEGYPCGGAEIPVRRGFVVDGEVLETIPATHHAIDRLPAGVTLHHWYWSLGRQYEHELQRRGIPFLFANFYPPIFTDFDDRIRRSGGVVLSHWSFVDEAYAQRHRGMLFSIAYAFRLLWSHSFTDSDYRIISEATFAELYCYRNRLRLPPASVSGSRGVEVVHTTDHVRELTVFTDGRQMDPAELVLGHYRLEYDDGTTFEAPIREGLNIGHHSVSWDRQPDLSNSSYTVDWQLFELAWSTCPEQRDNQTYYRHMIVNPQPDKKIVAISCQVPEEADYTITVERATILPSSSTQWSLSR